MPKSARHLAPKITDHGRVRRTFLAGAAVAAVAVILAGCALAARTGAVSSIPDIDVPAISIPNPGQKNADQAAKNAAAEAANRMLRDISTVAGTAQDQAGIAAAVTIGQQFGHYRMGVLPSNIDSLGGAPYGAVVYGIEPLGDDGATLLAYADGTSAIKQSLTTATGKAFGCMKITIHALNTGTDVTPTACPSADWIPSTNDGWARSTFDVKQSPSPTATATPSAE